MSTNTITGTTLFFVNYEYNVNLFLKLKKSIILIKQVNIIVNKMQKIHKKLKTDIEFLSHRSAFYYNQHYAEALTLKKRDKIYLLQKNIKITRLSSKLNYIRIRTFKIIINIKETSFKLEFSKDMQQKHSVFYVSLLEPAPIKVPVLTQILNNYLMK